MSLTPQHRQEDLSVAYILAIAAKAGYNCGKLSMHDYGIDIEIRTVESINNKRVDMGCCLDIQAKSSYNFSSSNDRRYILYDLNVDTYNMLIQKRVIPAILVLYCMPRDEDEWVSVDENFTTLKHCGYWISLKGMPRSENSATLSIRIPKEQLFNESSLKSIMNRIINGDAL